MTRSPQGVDPPREVILTGGVVVGGGGLVVAVVAMVTEQGLVVVVLVPVEGLDLQAAPLRVTAHDAGHGLVDQPGGALGQGGAQVLHLLTEVPPAVHTGQLGGEGGEKGRGREGGWGRDKGRQRRQRLGGWGRE